MIEIAAQLDDGKGMAQTVAEVKDANKRGALHFAAREGKTEMCKFLIEDLKLDINVKDEDGILLVIMLCSLLCIHIYVHTPDEFLCQLFSCLFQSCQY